MRIPIGEMREPVAIMLPVTAADHSGGQETTYTDSDPLFVSMRSPTTKEAKEFGQINANVSHVAFGHWHDLNALPSDARLKHLETLDEYEISGLPMNDQAKQFTRLSLIRRENG